ncbi:MAG TPA: hypothetical protein VF798_17800 [Burkholderiaceae bacterium]
MDENVLQQIRANARLVVDKLGPHSGIQQAGVHFGYNRESVEYLTGLIERLRLEEANRPEPPETLVSTLGSFFGECLAAATGGKWYRDEELELYGIALVSPQGQQHSVFPFSKIAKQFANGVEGGDSVLGMYDIVVDGLATGKMDR